MTKILGITDDFDSCDCCGRTNLKRVVVLDIDGDIVNYGTSCAAAMLGRTNAQITRTAQTAQYEVDRRAEKVALVEEIIADEARFRRILDKQPHNVSAGDLIERLRREARA